MASSYKIKKDGTTLLKLVSVKESRRNKGVEVPTYKAKVYLENDVVAEGDLAPIHIQQYDDNYGDIREKIERIGGQKAEKKSEPAKKQQPKKKELASSKKEDKIEKEAAGVK